MKNKNIPIFPIFLVTKVDDEEIPRKGKIASILYIRLLTMEKLFPLSVMSHY